MRTLIVQLIIITLLSSYVSVLAQSEKGRKGKVIPKATFKATSQHGELPPQPKSDRLALPDITIKEFKFSGPSGPWAPGQTVQVGVVLENIGQYETGIFLLKLDVRIQVPSIRKDETSTIKVKQIASIQPRKTGVSSGTYTASFNYTIGNYDWAQYTFTAVADYTSHIEEFDEANNEKTSIDQVVDTLR